MGMDPLTIGILGSAVIGGISSNSAARRADKAASNQQRLNARSLAIQQRQQLANEQRSLAMMAEYEKMKAIYGPLQEDLGTYFSNLTGEKLSNDRIAKLQKASQEAKMKIQQNLAQSGRSDSGLEQYLLAQQDYSTEVNKAQIRVNAETDALNQKMQYLGLASNQAQQYLSQANGYLNAMQGNINSQVGINTNSGISGINAATRQNQIYGNYADQLQGLIGFATRLQLDKGKE